uniref:Reverse transcriptase Ty1/copia-type domain-containing protein n=1 Tax=Fagus sylvatica TaxID=28930 RepID=A0A2N9J0X9_FAGSY
MKKLFNLKMAEGAAVTKHLNEFIKISCAQCCEGNDHTTNRVVHTKELFTMYKARDFVMLKNVRHVLDLCFNLISTPVMDRAGYCNHLGNGRWKLTKGSLVATIGRICCGMYKTHAKAYKKKFNVVQAIEKTPQLKAEVNSVSTKRIKFSLSDSATDEGEEPSTLEIVEPHERWSTRKLRKYSSKNIWAFDEGESGNWIKDIQGEINSLRMKGIDIDDVFFVLVKIMKKLELRVNLADMDFN